MAVAQPKRVLVVEDDHDLREALSDALEQHGHEVVATGDGREALRRMRLARPDVVLLDLMMPGLNGWDFRIEQRRDPELATTPVIAISASRSSAAAAVDADRFLEKPFSMEVVLQAIDEVLLAQERRLISAKVAHAERLAALARLAAGVAHEINNPLSYVLLQLTSVARELSEGRDPPDLSAMEHLRGKIASALQGIDRIRGITTGIRRFSELDDCPQVVMAVRAPLEAALDAIGSLLRSRAQVVKFFGATPPVLANQAHLGQVFLHILTNAIDAIPDDEPSRHEIRVTTRTRADGQAVVEITDTGCGIPEHVLGHVFEPFFTTKPIGEGAGLGLSSSHGIVRSLGGELDIASRAERGTTVRIVLPPAPASMVPAVSGDDLRTTTPIPVPSRRKVLVVDHDATVGATLAEALADRYDVSVAASGHDALERLTRGDAYDSLVCELQLPDLLASELHERVRAISPRLAGRMIFLNAGAFSAEARAFLVSGRHPSLQKPIDPDRLQALLVASDW